tara:strand:- start:247 stop:555 length:309 start_codon:yes stop_codon:yes gene_type:complete
MEVEETNGCLLARHKDGRFFWHYPSGVNCAGSGEYDLIAPAAEPEGPAAEAKSLRDEFAMAALTGIISGWGPGAPLSADRAAAMSYGTADAMLAERAKGGAE